jgi:hypothetical protein
MQKDICKYRLCAHRVSRIVDKSYYTTIIAPNGATQVEKRSYVAKKTNTAEKIKILLVV